MLLARLFLILGGALLLACSETLPRQVAASPPVDVSCKSGEGVALPEMGTIVALQRNVEKGPLYTVPAAAGVAECRIGYESGVIALEYRFRDGGWLRVKRDSSIEYTEQEAHFSLLSQEQAVPILVRAERTAFGVNGCGINWQQTETLPVRDDTSTTETIFRGDVCNCQARIRRDNAGHVVGLALRSAC